VKRGAKEGGSKSLPLLASKCACVSSVRHTKATAEQQVSWASVRGAADCVLTDCFLCCCYVLACLLPGT
jgi:hypothetical protein